jgi:hypothetical protein
MPSSQVLTKRRVKRRQQRLRLVSKNAKRKVRSVRKHRKTAKKVMRGGADIKSDILLEGNPNTPVIKLNLSKDTFGSTYTLEIEIDLDVYPYDVKSLLIELFESVKPITLEIKPTIIDKISKQVTPNYRSFLIGLADIPERKGCLPTANWLIKTALTTDDPPLNDMGLFHKKNIRIKHSNGVVKEYARQNRQEIVDATANIKTDLLETNKKCTVIMTLSEKDGILFCKVTKYTCIGINSYSYHYHWYTRKQILGVLGEHKSYSESAILYTPTVTDRRAGGKIDYMFSEDSEEYKEQMKTQFDKMVVRPQETFKLIDHAVDAKDAETTLVKTEEDKKLAATMKSRETEKLMLLKDVRSKLELFQLATEKYNNTVKGSPEEVIAERGWNQAKLSWEKAKNDAEVANKDYESSYNAYRRTKDYTWKPYVIKNLNNDNNTFNMKDITIAQFIESMFKNEKKIKVVKNTENENMPKIEITGTSKQAVSPGEVPVDVRSESSMNLPSDELSMLPQKSDNNLSPPLHHHLSL